MSVARDHADWLSLLEISGPFVSMPVLMRVFPQGLDPRDPEQARQLRLAYEEWQSNPAVPGKQRGWIIHVLSQLLKFPADLIAEGQRLPPGLSAAMLEYGETLRPDLALLGPKGTEAAGKPQLLVSIYSPDQLLDRPMSGKHWKATPGTRMMELLHAADISLGLVTNGEQWMLVFAPRGETTGFASWYATLWIEEQVTLRAFHSLLSINRFFGVAASDTLSAIMKESAKDQQEVTNQLGEQVRDAVEVLIQAFDRLDHESGRTLLKGVEEKTLYDAALTVMMRLVFLFSAEERDLLHLGRPIYDNNYAVSTLREQLQEVADRYGEEVLERRFDAWARLLSSFRAVHGGVQHQDLLMPAYGGSLFDPDRYAFLEGRAQETDWRVTTAEPLAINNRVVLHLLKSLQMLQVKVPGGGPAEAHRISFRALDIEQIGHIYEGLLDHTASRAEDTVLGLVGTRKNPTPNITLNELEMLAVQGEDKLLEELKGLTNRGIPALKSGLATNASEDNHKILVACAQDEKLGKRVTRFLGLLREDSFERPVVVLHGGIYVSKGTARSSTGTHYTPRSLTEPVVQHTLEPLIYRGPVEGLPKEQWELKSPQEILGLKVCDMTMGSGAFLVQTCRYLSERLTEAWENLERARPGELLITPEGLFSKGEPSERLIPKDANERLAIARRLIADRCLYGVDINPMAVEMAKLSIWLITVDTARPFTFLDHSFKYGDSLLGISRFKQLAKFSLDDTQDTQVIILSNYDELIRLASIKRQELEALPSNEAAQIAAKQALNTEAEELIGRLKLAADLLIVAALAESSEKGKEVARVGAHLQVTEFMGKPLDVFRQFVHDQLGGQRPFHWPLEFPEVFECGGFDAFIGNPPFLGGSKITIAYSTEYRDFLVNHLAANEKGKADLSVYFILEAFSLLASDGNLGLVVTTSVTEGDARRIGLDRIVKKEKPPGFIYRAEPSMNWPGSATVTVTQLWIHRGRWGGSCFIGEKQVEGITAALTSHEEGDIDPLRLQRNQGVTWRGTEIKGPGFVLSEEQAEQLLSKDPKNREVIFPYISGEDINSNPSHTSNRWVINFHDWPYDKAILFRDCFEITRTLVKPYRDTITKQIHEPDFWKLWDKRLANYSEIKGRKEVLAIALVTKHVAYAFVPVGPVYSNKVQVLSFAGPQVFAVLQSSLHYHWAWKYSPRNLSLLAYSPVECIEKFPLPPGVSHREITNGLANGKRSALSEIGNTYSGIRREIMLSRHQGLTDTYNRFHDPKETSSDVGRLRELHSQMDYAVASVYGWTDVDLGHGFHETRQGIRYTLCEPARRMVLHRLLSLNHRYHEEEKAEASVSAKDARVLSSDARGRKKKVRHNVVQDALFAAEDSE